MANYDDTATVSGSIAYFSDGADDVPTKSVKVTIPPTLSGVSSVGVENEGNLCDFDDYNVEANTNTTVPLGADLTLRKGTYTLTFNISDTVTATRNRPCYVVSGNYTYADSDYKTSGRYSWTFTLSDEATLSIRWLAHTVSANITISDFMLTYGSTAHDYEPYTTPTTYTANLGRTIYGGEVDIVNGTGTDENGNDFTFDGQEIPTRKGYNAFWSEQGDSEVTYYKDGYGFTSVTVNRCGKNLWSSDKDLSITRDKTVYMRIPRGTYTLSFDFVSSTASPVPSYMQVAYSTTDGTKYNPVTVVEGRCSRTFTLSADARALTIYSSTSYSASVGVTTVVNNIQLEVGSQASSYEPYEAVSKTAYLHKVIYAGEVDVIKGTAKPKNLLANLGTFPFSSSATAYYFDFTTKVQARKIPTFRLQADTNYSLSMDVECDNEPFNISVGCGKDGSYQKDIKTTYSHSSGRCSISFSVSQDFIDSNGDIFAFRVPRYGGSTQTFNVTIDNVQLEIGDTASEYAPHFDPFTFPPISMSTDYGENTLFANEGASAITYRKETD